MEYLVSNFIGFVVWIFLFLLRKDLRREMVVMSMLAAPSAIVDLFFVPGYWQPRSIINLPIGPGEGFIFSFLIGGISAVAYSEVRKVTPVKINNYHKHFSFVVFVLASSSLVVLGILRFSQLIVSLYIALLIGILITNFLRRDLWRSTIIGAATFGVIYFLLFSIWSYIFPHTIDWFYFEGLPKIFILNVPIWEILFAIFFAGYWGNLYELIFGYKFRKKK